MSGSLDARRPSLGSNKETGWHYALSHTQNDGGEHVTSDLNLKQKIDLFGSNLVAKMGLNRRVPVRIYEEEALFIVSFEDREVALPTAQRWHRYKRGWKARGDRLLHQFGVSEVTDLSLGDTVIDIGANVGEFSISAADMGATVHAIEGDPLVFRCLSRNCATNERITPYRHVLWNDDTQVTFYSEPTDANSSVIEPTEGGKVTPITVNAVRLDTWAKQAGVENVQLIKCDAEGAEPEVIKGAEEVLRRTKFCAFDTGDERMGEETSDECEGLLSALGFRVFHDRRPNRKITFGVRD